MAIGGILQAAARVAQAGAKAGGAAAKAGAKAGGKAAGKASKKAGKKVKSAAKRKVGKIKSGITKSLGLGGLGALIGTAMDAKNKANETNAANAATAAAAAAQGDQTPTPTDSTISFEGLAASIQQAMPNLEGLDNSSNRSASNMASLIFREDVGIQMDDLQEDLNPIIPAGTFVSSRILELGNLHGVVDMLRQQVGLLNVDMGQVNDNLSLIADKLGIAIDQNARTNRANERQRDEEDVENTEKASMLGNLINDAKTSAKAGAAVVAGILATAVGGALVMTTGFLLEDAAEEAATTPDEGTGVQETAAEAEEVPVENSQSALTDFANWMEKAEDQENTEDKTVLQSAVGASMDNVGTGLAVAGIAASVGTAVGVAALAPVAPLAAAATAGYIAGTVIYEQTGLKEGINDMIVSHLEGESLDIGASTDPATMREKYNGKDGVSLLGDLLGEGMFDLAEDPNDIAAFFRDNIQNMEEFNQLNSEYQEEYDRPITSALNDVLGTKGVESIFDIILANAIKKMEEAKAKQKAVEPSNTGITLKTEPPVRESITLPKPSPTIIRPTPIPMPAVMPSLPKMDISDLVTEPTGLPVDIEFKPDAPSVDIDLGGISDSGVRVARRVANQNIGFDTPLVRQGVMGAINALGSGDSKTELNRIIKGGVMRREISEMSGLSTSVIREAIDMSAGNGDTTRMVKAVINTELMPELEGEIREAAQTIIPILAPVATGRSTMGEAAGNTTKKVIGSAISSIRTDDKFLSGALNLFT